MTGNTCPDCEQPLGADYVAIGPWRPVEDEQGVTQAVERSIYVSCPHCGPFELIQDHQNRITNRHGPFTNDKDIRRIERHIPACRHDRRIPA